MAQARKKSESSVSVQLFRHIRQLLRESGFLLLLGIAIFLLLALLSYHPQDPAWTHTASDGAVRNLGGTVGALFADVVHYFLGQAGYILPAGLAFCGWRVFRHSGIDLLDLELIILRVMGFVVMLAAASALGTLYFNAGGIIGSLVAQFLIAAFGYPGGLAFLFALLLAGFTLGTGLSWGDILDGVGEMALAVASLFGGLFNWTQGHLANPNLVEPMEAEPAFNSDSEAEAEAKAAAVKPQRREPSLGGTVADELSPAVPVAPSLSPEATSAPVAAVESTPPVLNPSQAAVVQRISLSATRPVASAEPAVASSTVAPAAVTAPPPAPAPVAAPEPELAFIPPTRAPSVPLPEEECLTFIPHKAEPVVSVPAEPTLEFIPSRRASSALSPTPASAAVPPVAASTAPVVSASVVPPSTGVAPPASASAAPVVSASVVPPSAGVAPPAATSAAPVVSASVVPPSTGVAPPASASAAPAVSASVVPPSTGVAPPAATSAAPAVSASVVAPSAAVASPTLSFIPPAPLKPQLPPAPAPVAKPALTLLDALPPHRSLHDAQSLDEMSRQVEVLLRHFGVEVKVVAVEPGPVITRFELDPAPGVKGSQISNLARDLARGLSVLSVRVVEVIPGKSVIGLEIPNPRREIVHLLEVLASSAYQDASSCLTLALGKDIGGHPVVANLAKMPHLLVAGTTGSGKSVAINVMLLSLLYKASPQEVRLILIDPKMLELSMYEDIPHLLAPVVTDMKEAANALRWCVAEMERRYRLMAAVKVRNIANFNRLVSEAIASGQPLADPLYKPNEQLDPHAAPPALVPLPFIVVVIDELADMMMVAGKKVEELIARLAQKARASGIHLILATQRPSVDVITGLIKANIPTRIAFQVSSKIDSRTILDQMGAEQLLGHGDMLYLPPGTGFPQRVHGAFVDDHELVRVVDELKRCGRPDYLDDILQGSSEPTPGIASEMQAADDSGESDPLYDQAVQVVLESRRASISYVQRRLKIGYNRAARLIEDMEAAGLVGAPQNNGNREVLVPNRTDEG